MRQQLVKFRTAQINGLRGLFDGSVGEVMPRWPLAGLRRGIVAVFERSGSEAAAVDGHR